MNEVVMSQSVEFHVHGTKRPIKLELDQGQEVVLGRDPEGTNVREGARYQHVAEEAVSRRHVAVAYRRDGSLYVEDLRSTNETWILLRKGQSVTLQTEGTLRVGVAMAPVAQHVESDPAEAQWRHTEEYPSAVAVAVEAWLSEVNAAARIKVVDAQKEEAPSPLRLPLRGGASLLVVPSEDTTRLGAALLQRLHAYVAQQNNLYDRRAEATREGVILESEAILEAWREVAMAARAGMRVLLLGPTGSGKTVLARCYHRAWNPIGPFQHVNCSQFGGDRTMNHARLFGAAPGSFTGAPRKGLRGCVEAADGGTLFLDEVAELDLDTQKALLTFLDDGNFTPVGADAPRHASVRLVCATNSDLRAAVKERRFREDLWYRLCGVEVRVPPLGERPEDVRGYLRQLSEPFAAAVVAALSPAAWELLSAQPWRGGFREVRNVVQHLALRHDQDAPIDVRECLEALRRASLDPRDVVLVTPLPPTGPTAREADDEERAVWRGVLNEAFERFEPAGDALTYEQLVNFIEECLKPAFMVRACDLVGRTELPRNVRLQELAEKVGCNRTTVKTHLERYFSHSDTTPQT